MACFCELDDILLHGIWQWLNKCVPYGGVDILSVCMYWRGLCHTGLFSLTVVVCVGDDPFVVDGDGWAVVSCSRGQELDHPCVCFAFVASPWRR